MRRGLNGRNGRRGKPSVVAAAPAPPVFPLGAICVEYWEQDVGIALVGGLVDTWTGQKLGKVLPAVSPADRCAYVTDGANFHGAKVVIVTQTNLLQGTGLALASGTRPCSVMVRRYQTLDTVTEVQALGTTTAAIAPVLTTQQGAFYGAEAFFWGIAEQKNIASSTVQHAIEQSSSAGTGSIYIDGAAPVTRTAAVAPGTIDNVSIGGGGGGSNGAVAIAGLYLLNAQMSAGERASLQAYFVSKYL